MTIYNAAPHSLVCCLLLAFNDGKTTSGSALCEGGSKAKKGRWCCAGLITFGGQGQNAFAFCLSAGCPALLPCPAPAPANRKHKGAMGIPVTSSLFSHWWGCGPSTSTVCSLCCMILPTASCPNFCSFLPQHWQGCRSWFQAIMMQVFSELP